MFLSNTSLSKALARSPKSSSVSTRLTREGLQFVFLLMFVVIAAILQSINLLVLMSGALLGMLLIQWRLATRTLTGIRVQRSLPPAVQARCSFAVQLAFENPRPRLGSWLLLIRDRLIPKDTPLGVGSNGHGITLLLDRLLPQQTRLLSYECMLPRRGRYLFLEAELSTRFPLSLMRSFRSLPISESLTVHPAQGKLDPHWRELLKLPVQGRIHRQSSNAGGDGEFYGLRDYRPGDPVRHVHWRTSAKRSALVIRQFEREENQAIGVVLDLWRSPKPSPTDSDLLELAIELVSTIVARVVAVERSVATLTIADDQGTVVARIQTANQLSASLDRLAVVDASKSDCLPSALRQTLRYTGGRDPIVVVSTRPNREYIDRLASSASENELKKEKLIGLSDMALEGRTIWIDVSHDRLENFFVRG